MSARFGEPRVRAEDGALLRGAGRYLADLAVPETAHMAVLRSEVAAGRLRGLDVSAARAAPGVLAVLTGAEMAAAGIRPFAVRFPPPGLDPTPHYPLVHQRICRVGEPIAAVIAGTEAQALDAVEALEVDVEEDGVVVAAGEALAADAPLVWPERGTNRAFSFEAGDGAAVDRALAEAAHVVTAELDISRVTALSLEPRSILVVPGPEGGLTVHCGVQSAHRLRDELAEALGLSAAAIRVIVPDTGGGFGMKVSCYPEYVLAAWAARVTGRPVRWIAQRTEAFLSDTQGRAQSVTASLALDPDGNFTALRVESVVPIGGQIGQMSIHPTIANLGGLAGMYRTPAIHARVRGALVNAQHMAPYRGAGRPEATYVIERMIDIAAARLGRDRVALRRQNLIPPEAMPCATPLGFAYDSGDFPAILARALELGDAAGFPARRVEAAARGRLRGLGVACAIEIAGGPRTGSLPEHAAITLDPAAGGLLACGSVDTGQGHATTLGQIVEALLGWPADRLRVVSGDTGRVASGTGSFGSRTMGAAGTAIARVCDEIIEAARADAAAALEVAPADLDFAGGAFRVAGTDVAITLEALVTGRGHRYAATLDAVADAPTYPNGCHLCEVEIDPETGACAVVAYSVVDDVGTVINPLLLKGQIHGGVAQGLGQALGEAILHDPATGQQLTASLMDYAVPRAGDLPMLRVASLPTPTRANPLGVKGAGEAGTVGALAAGINAVCDALAPLGVVHIDMPATPARIWAAMAAARQKEERRT